MERNVMGELNVYRGSGAKPNFSEIARRHGMDRHTVAKYWREGESAADGRSARGSAFDPLEEVIRAKAQCYRQWKIGQLRYCKLPNGVTPVYPTSTTPSQPSYGSLLLSVGTSLSL